MISKLRKKMIRLQAKGVFYDRINNFINQRAIPRNKREVSGIEKPAETPINLGFMTELCKVFHSDSMYPLLNHPLKLLLSTLGQLDFHIIQQSDRGLVVVLVMNDVIQVDQEGFVGPIEIIVRQVAFDFLENAS